jgi:succinyl-CoA synthetase beta subunit
MLVDGRLDGERQARCSLYLVDNNGAREIQTGPEGQTVRQVLVEEGCDIARELYLGIVLDRAAAMPVLMVSSEGGVEIEKVAAETPELIFKEHFDPLVGLQDFQVRKLCQRLNITGAASAAPRSS